MQGPQPSQDLAPPEIFPINPSVRPWKIPLYLPSPCCDSQCNSQKSSNTSAPLGICLISAGLFPLNTHKALEMRYPTFPPFFFLSRVMKSKHFYSSGAAGLKRQIQKSWHYLCAPNILVWMEYFTSCIQNKQPQTTAAPEIPSVPWEKFPAGSSSIYFIYLHGK